MKMEDLKRIGDQASVSVAMMHPAMRTPELRDVRLEPRLWEDLRIRLQETYRLATGENQAILTIENGAS